MKPIITELLEFVEKNQTGPSLVDIESELGKSNLRVIAIKLLCWFKIQAKRENPQPLELTPTHPWCERLRHLVKENAQFSEIFKVEDNNLDFQMAITQDERAQIQRLVSEKFNPPLFR